MTGADLVVEHLKQTGVARVFTLCGNGLDPFHAACDDAGLALVTVHNEQAAAYMAEVEGRLTRSVGVCAVSSGVAHSNALTGVVNAFYDGSPLLLISGASEQESYGLGHFQELDQVALAAPVCKLARRVTDPLLVGRAIDEACATAAASRPGPVHLTIPVDVFDADVPDSLRPTGDVSVTTHVCTPADAELIERAACLVKESRRPVIVAGSGVYYADAERPLAAFAAAAGAPIMIPIWDRGCVCRPSPDFAGFLGPASGEPDLLADADLVILAGARVDYRLGYLAAPAVADDLRVIRISADPVEIDQGRPADVALAGDPASVFNQLLEAAPAAHASWRDEARKRVEAFRARWRLAPREIDSRMTGGALVEALAPFITDDTLFLIDGGDIGQWAHMLLGDRYPGHWLTCGASGVVGWGLPGAIAAKLRHPQSPVILLSGDGSAGFTMAELEVAVRYNTTFVMVFADDGGWGIVTAGQTKKYGRAISSHLGPIRYDLVAEGFGAKGVCASNEQEVATALRDALAGDRPTVIHVPTSPCSPTTVF